MKHRNPRFLLTFAFLGSGLASAQTPAASLAHTDPTQSSSARLLWADFDGDGAVDLYSAALGRADVLQRNLGDGRFADVTMEAGLAGLRSREVHARDFDQDGDLDLLTLAQDGGLRLLEASDGAFLESDKLPRSQQTEPVAKAAWTDFDGDGWIDFWAESATGEPSVYRNVRGRSFERVALDLPVAAQPAIAAPGAGESGTSPDPESLAAGSADASDTASAPREGSPGRVPVDVSTSGVDVSLTASHPSAGGVQPIIGISCATSIANQNGSGCITASTSPGVLGRLLAQTANLFVASSGRVGIATTNPQAGLHVNNRNLRLDGNFILGEDNDVIQFPPASGATQPMISMFASGFSNADRMILSQSPGDPNWGLEYEDVGDRFKFQRSTTDPVFEVDLGNRFVRSFANNFHHFGDMLVNGQSNTAVLHLQDTKDAELILDADTNNNSGGEADQPAVIFRQDGGLVETVMGFQRSENSFSIENLYEFADINLRVKDTGVSGQMRDFNFQNINSVGSVQDTEGRLTALGDWQIDGSVSSPAADLAEYYPLSGSVEPGDVVTFVDDDLHIAQADRSMDVRLAAVVSSKPGITLGMSYTDESQSFVAPSGISDEDRFIGDEREFWIDRCVLHEIAVNQRAPLALAGRVPVKVTSENGPIRIGDPLTVSSIPGHAMLATEPGAIVGTALQSWTGGEGKILILVNFGTPVPTR